MPDHDIEERFWKRVRKTDACWEWTGAHTGGGYGATYKSGRQVVAHRIAYELLVGPIPEGLQLDHLCRNRGCVNPAHLEPVSQRVNLLRGDTVVARHAAKTHCDAGHPFDLFNTYWWHGARHCRACRRERMIRFFAAHPKPKAQRPES